MLTLTERERRAYIENDRGRQGGRGGSMSTRQRKTRDTWQLWMNYGAHGWEHELTEYSRAEARDRLREYRENCPQYPARVVMRRERIAQAAA